MASKVSKKASGKVAKNNLFGKVNKGNKVVHCVWQSGYVVNPATFCIGCKHINNGFCCCR